MKAFRPPFLLAALLTSFLVFSSTAQSITGVVTGPDGSPVEGATVFVHYTTLSTTSGADGSFTLEAPPQYAFEVAAAAEGMAPTGLQVSQEGMSDVQLQLSEAVPSSGSAPDEDLLDTFVITAFSYTRAARDIEMVNPEDLRISLDEASGIITVESVAPFTFVNPALGYRVTIHGFQLGGNAVGYGWSGYALFEPMTSEKSKDLKNWEKRREDTYEGSRRHFLTALLDGSVKDEEWAAWFVSGPGAAEDHSPIQEAELKSVYGDPQPILFENEWPGVSRLDWGGWLRVKYFGNGGDGRWPEFIDRYWPVSDLSEVLASEMNITFVELPSYQAFVSAGGVLLPSVEPGTRELGYWTFHRLADTLPNDWMPEK